MKKEYTYRNRRYIISDECRPFGIAYTANGYTIESDDFDQCDNDERPERMKEARKHIERIVTRNKKIEL